MEGGWSVCMSVGRDGRSDGWLVIAGGRVDAR